MELTFEFWYLLPISIIIATIAMSSGLGGAVFFSPLFILALKLDPKVAIGAALATEFFGFTSGVIAYSRSKLFDFKPAGNLLLFSIPFAIIGTVYSEFVLPIILKAVFAVGLIFIGFQLYNAFYKRKRQSQN